MPNLKNEGELVGQGPAVEVYADERYTNDDGTKAEVMEEAAESEHGATTRLSGTVSRLLYYKQALADTVNGLSRAAFTLILATLTNIYIPLLVSTVENPSGV